MNAKQDITCRFNGADFTFKKGEEVTEPAALVAYLKECGLLAEPRKRKVSAND